MKLTQMIEKFAKQGMMQGTAKADLERAAQQMESEMQNMQEALDGKEEQLAQERKTAAVERAILEAGGKNVKAILALIDLEEVTYEEEKGLTGLDLEAVQEEAPYLFYEKTEKRKGTGMTRGSKGKKEDEIREAFRRGLGR